MVGNWPLCCRGCDVVNSRPPHRTNARLKILAFARRAARRGHARMALLQLSSLGGPFEQSLHLTDRPRVQGIRGANGADALSNASYLRRNKEAGATNSEVRLPGR
jgi:hypothetical protein